MFMVLGETISKYVFHIMILLKHSGYSAFFISHLCSFHFKFEMKMIQVFPGPIVQIFSDYLFEWKRTMGQIFMVLGEMISKYVFHITMLLKHSGYPAFFISHLCSFHFKFEMKMIQVPLYRYSLIMCLNEKGLWVKCSWFLVKR